MTEYIQKNGLANDYLFYINQNSYSDIPFSNIGNSTGVAVEQNRYFMYCLDEKAYPYICKEYQTFNEALDSAKDVYLTKLKSILEDNPENIKLKEKINSLEKLSITI